MSIEPLDDPIFTPDETAVALHSNPRTLERWRTTGDGPAFVKIGRRVGYRKSAIATYIEQRTRTITETRRSAK
jgi:hypothetical protein